MEEYGKRTGRKYLINEETLEMIYKLIDAPSDTKQDRLDKAEGTIKLMLMLQDQEVSPWDV